MIIGGGGIMIDKLIEPQVAAHRLSVSVSTIHRMFNRGLLSGIRTGPTLKLIRISEMSLNEHISEQMQQETQEKQGIL